MKQKSQTIKMPKATLMAIKKMLFTSEGVDLSNIIDDLAGVQADADLTAINVALVFKGVTIDTGESTRYAYEYCRYYERTFESVSLILDQIVYSYKMYRHQEDGTYKESESGKCSCPVAEWLESDTELDLSQVRGV